LIWFKFTGIKSQFEISSARRREKRENKKNLTFSSILDGESVLFLSKQNCIALH